MKLAEALSERKAIKAKMEELKQRIYRNAQTQEGEAPSERPEDLIAELRAATGQFAALVARINATNARADLDSGESLTSAVLRKDMLRYLHMVCANLADKGDTFAGPLQPPRDPHGAFGRHRRSAPRRRRDRQGVSGSRPASPGGQLAP
jgi:hypothetical protein